MLKKILTYFQMLIVPHALHCVDSCIFVFTSLDTVWHTVLVSVPLPTPSPKFFFIRFSFFVKIHLLESSQSCRVTPPPPPFPKFLCPATKSGGVLCYTLRTFECLSVRLSVRPSVRQRLNIRVRSITLIPFEIISRNLVQM